MFPLSTLHAFERIGDAILNYECMSRRDCKCLQIRVVSLLGSGMGESEIASKYAWHCF